MAGGFRHVLGHQVSGPRIALYVGLRQPVDQVVEVALGEHGIPRSPEQQGRYAGQPGQALGHAVEGGPARVFGLQWDVGHEVTDRPPVCCVAVGRGQRVANLTR